MFAPSEAMTPRKAVAITEHWHTQPNEEVGAMNQLAIFKKWTANSSSSPQQRDAQEHPYPIGP